MPKAKSLSPNAQSRKGEWHSPSFAPAFALSSVSTDEQGLPARFRVLGWGTTSFTQEGNQAAFDFTKEQAQNIVDQFSQRSSDLPIDCEHLAFQVAKALKMEEQDLSPFYMAKAAIGWWKPEVGEDGLYAVVTKWSDLATKIIKNRLWRYFSPVIRGIQSGQIRITSIALTNTPALDQLDELVASAAVSSILKLKANVIALNRTTKKTKGTDMNKVYAALISIFGADAVALSAEGEITNDDALAKQVTAFHQKNTTLTQTMRKELALSADTSLDSLTGTFIASVAKAKADALALSTVTAERDAMVTAAAEKEHEDLMAAGLAAGKLASKEIEAWAKTQTNEILKAWLAAAPAMVQPGRIVTPDKPQDANALSSELNQMAKGMGLSTEDINTYGGK